MERKRFYMHNTGYATNVKVKVSPSLTIYMSMECRM